MVVLMFGAAAPSGASAQSGGPDTNAPGHGLMWQRTGLPAVFPLHVKTNPGEDYFMRISDAETDADALAAYIEGGRYFKVLVPPGRYQVRFAVGQRWQGEDTLFGTEGTRLFEVPQPLTFEVVGLGAKAGHIVDLTSPGNEIVLGDSYICDRIAVSDWPRPQAAFDPDDRLARRFGPEDDLIEFPSRLAQPRIPDRRNGPVISGDFAPYFSPRRLEIRQTPC
jgi:hypothetical protein